MPPPLIPHPPAPPPLRKFTLHPPALTAPGSPLNAITSSSGPVTNELLASVRKTLLESRSRSSERASTREANRRNISDRQSNEKKAAEEGARIKEVERKRRKEEDERRERERIERGERERLEREKEEFAEKRRQEEIFEESRRNEEEAKRIEDEQAREVAVRRAREAKDKDKAVEVLSIVAKNEASRVIPPTSSPIMDVSMTDAPTISLNTSSVPTIIGPPPSTAPSTSHTLAPSALHTDVSAPSTQVSDAEDEDGHVAPLFRHKSTDKKKRKRDQVVDSDASDSDGGDEPLLQKVRKLEEKSRAGSTGPPPSRDASIPSAIIVKAAVIPVDDPDAGLTPLELKLKEEKFVKHSIPTGKQPAVGTATAFYLPKHQFVPVKPDSKPNPPTAKKQSEVSEDFSKAKPGTQTAHHTFHTWAEAYLRPFGEDDLAFLAPKPEDISPYLIPPLGNHYLDRWEEEDADGPIASTSYASPLEPPVLPRFRPEALTEDALGMENVFLGPLSERLLAALDFEEGGEPGELEETYDREEELMPTRSQVIDAVDLEERIKKELRFIGILGEEDVDWSAREDDEVSSTLRACQQLLHRQTALNEGRRAMLSSIVKDRMAYQEYEATRDAQERVIESGWTKRQRTGKKKSKKERERAPDGPKPPVSVALLTAIDKREKLVTAFRPFFEEDEDKARYFGIPEKSIYEGVVLDDDGQPLALTE